MLSYVLLGLAGGSVVALLTLGLVCEYKASGVVNFAHAAMAMYAAYVYSELKTAGDLLLPVVVLPHSIAIAGGPMATGPAIVVAVAYSAALGGAIYGLVFRPIRRGSPLTKVVASIGVSLILQTLAVQQFGSEAQVTPSILPQDAVDVFGTTVSQDRLIMAGVALLLGALLAGVYRWTYVGVATRAVRENERSATLLGCRPVRLETANWMFAGVLAGVAGVLAAPVLSLSPGTFSLLIVPTLAAALLGGFTSFMAAAAGGLAIGIIQSLCLYASTTWSWFPQQGVPDAAPFVLILGILLVRGRRLPVRESFSLRLPAAPTLPLRSWHVAVVVALGFAAVVLSGGQWRASVIQSIVTTCVCLSLVVVTGYGGQLSLGQLAFAGVGGFALAKFLVHVDVPVFVALILAGLTAVPIGLLIALPALRIRGVNLAIVTLGAGVAASSLVFNNPQVSGSGGVSVRPPRLFGVDLGIYGRHPGDYPTLAFGLAALAVLLVIGAMVANLRRSPTGAHLLAVRANERAASALGIHVTSTKLLAFAISAFIAGAAGGLLGFQQGRLSPDSFTTTSSLTLLAITYVGGIGSVVGALAAGLLLAPGGVAFTAIQHVVNIGGYEPMIAGVGVTLAAITQPDGMARDVARLARRLANDGGRPDAQSAARPRRGAKPRHVATRPGGPALSDTTPVLEVENLRVAFGGLVALDGVRMTIAPGEIHGLIGPNGAGKTTFIDTVTGFHRPQTGEMRLEGGRLNARSATERARAGISRTFQSGELFDDFTVRDNLVPAVYRRGWGSSLLDMAAPRRGGHDPVIDHVLELVGIGDLRDRTPAELSHGQRKLVAIARALAGRPKLLLLDEPAAGLDETESEELGLLLARIAAEGTTILLVEHDLSLVRSICGQLTVLDFGKVIASGAAAGVLADQAVIDAYIGPNLAHVEAV